MSTWFAANQLSLNLSKTNFMVFKPWQKSNRLNFKFLYINEQSILSVSETMFLGVFLDDNLTWKPHISLLASKLSKFIGIIHKSRFFSLNSISPYLVQFKDISILVLLRSSLGLHLKSEPSKNCNLTETSAKSSEQLYLRCQH